MPHLYHLNQRNMSWLSPRDSKRRPKHGSLHHLLQEGSIVRRASEQKTGTLCIRWRRRWGCCPRRLSSLTVQLATLSLERSKRTQKLQRAGLTFLPRALNMNVPSGSYKGSYGSTSVGTNVDEKRRRWRTQSCCLGDLLMQERKVINFPKSTRPSWKCSGYGGEIKGGSALSCSVNTVTAPKKWLVLLSSYRVLTAAD